MYKRSMDGIEYWVIFIPTEVLMNVSSHVMTITSTSRLTKEYYGKVISKYITGAQKRRLFHYRV